MPTLPNARHELYAQELAKGVPANKAYVNAGFAENDSNSIRVKARPEIQARIAEILGAAAEKVEITKERVLAELGRIGFSDIRKVFDENGSLKRIEELDDDAAASIASVEVVSRRMPGGERDEVENVTKIKAWDKRAALGDICKIMGWVVEKHEHTGKDGGPIETAELSETEKARRIAFALTRGTQQPAT